VRKLTVLGVDIGYGYLKAVSSDPESKPLRTPSLVGTGKELTLRGGLFGSNPDDLQVEIKEDGMSHSYFVGDLARRESPDAAYTMDENKINHQNTKVLLATACAALWPTNAHEPVHLVTGLPMSHYKAQRESFEQMLRKIDLEAKLIGRNDVPVRIKFDRVTVFPQGYGAAYAAILNEHGVPENPKEMLNHGGLIVVIGPGQKTTEVITFETKPKFKPVESLSFSFNLGGDNLVRDMKKVFESKAGASLPQLSVDQFLNEGQIWHYGKLIDAREERAQIQKSIGRAIFERAKSGLGDSVSLIHSVYLAGGNYQLVKPFSEEMFPSTKVIANPQFADANGFKMVGEILERKLAAGM
jgi:plasmid segregation protein ParM